ncbi:MAG: hypothetical protein IT324_32040 [Anaerolineae bacterium]|nr:hypothetical protein [Anaerolineae bacterium]
MDRNFQGSIPNLPAKDRYNDSVKRALIKEGWTILNSCPW